jgi:hypothetical protein
MTGVVFDAAYVEEQEELRTEVNRRGLWSVLDHRALELATLGGLTDRRKQLPWAPDRPHSPQDLKHELGSHFVGLIAEFVAEHHFSAVLAPSHFLEKGFNDPWLEVDIHLARQLRVSLDSLGRHEVEIYYPLALPTRHFFDSAQRLALRHTIGAMQSRIDGLWLRIHPFGASSGHVNLQRYILAARDLHALHLPLISEKAGTVGTALLAFGAVSGLEVGVSSGESFDVGRLAKRGKGKGFSPHRGVMIGSLGVILNQKDARSLLENKTLRANHACRNTSCCQHGAQDMIRQPRRHYTIQRMEEVSAIGQIPPTVRANGYLDNFLRPATDKLGRVVQADIPSRIKKKLERDRHKLDGWRNTLGQMSTFSPASSFATVPARRIVRGRTQ